MRRILLFLCAKHFDEKRISIFALISFWWKAHFYFRAYFILMKSAFLFSRAFCVTRLGDLLLFGLFLYHVATIFCPKFKTTFWQFLKTWKRFKLLQLSSVTCLGDFGATFYSNLLVTLPAFHFDDISIFGLKFVDENEHHNINQLNPLSSLRQFPYLLVGNGTN